MSETTLVTRSWAYQIDQKRLYLYEIDSNGSFVPPMTSETLGLKVTFTDGEDAFVDTNGDRVAPASADETSILSVSDPVALAVIYYIRSKLEEDKGDINKYEYYYKKFKAQVSIAKKATTSEPNICVPCKPYAIIDDA